MAAAPLSGVSALGSDVDPKNAEIIDVFGGIADINNKIIRAVGEPERRFSEDALRILRAVRFASTLGFEIEENTKVAAAKLSYGLQKVSIERKIVELKKTLSESVEGVTIGDDWYKTGDTLPTEALEILVGETNRTESVEMKAGLLEDDFAVKYYPESHRIVILGGSDEATVKAISYFFEFCFKNGEIESSLSFLSAGQYAVTECILNGSPIADYSLVIPDKADADEKYAA
jgi:hypothetical protein